MNENKLREYAKLIVKIGANVQKGQRVRLQAGVDQIPLAKMVTEECYKAGASYVEMFGSAEKSTNCIISMRQLMYSVKYRYGKRSGRNK